MQRRRSPLFARVLLCLALLCYSVLIVAGDWPTFLHDDLRGAASSGETLLSPANAAHLAKVWSFKTGGAVASSPTVANGVVYAGSWDGYEYALDAATGALKWRTYLGMSTSTGAHCVPAGGIGVSSAATVQDGVVYVGGGGAYWYALDAAGGHVLWRVYTGDNSQRGGHYNWSSPLIYNGYAYIGVASLCDRPLVQGQLLKVNLRTHAVVATFNAVPRGQVGGGVWTSPSVDAATNTLYVTTGSNGAVPTTQPLTIALVALDAATLAVKSSWQIPPDMLTSDSDWGDSPLLFDAAPGLPVVAAINKNGYLYTFRRAATGLHLLWGRPIARGGACPTCGDGSVSSGAAGAGRLYMAGGATVIGTTPYSGSVRAFDPATGGILWEHGTARAVIGALAYAHGLVVDGEGSVLEVLNAATGARLYSYATGGALYGAPSIAEGRVFVGSTDDAIYAFGFMPSGTFSGSIDRAGGSGGYAFTPSVSGTAAIGSCAVGAGANYDLEVYNRRGDLLGRAATPSACDWVSVNVTAGQTYAVTLLSARGSGEYRSAWSVNGVPQTWKVGGALIAGSAQSFTFPTLNAGTITLSTCGPGGGAFGLTLLDTGGTAVLSDTTPAACGSHIDTFISTARGPFRLLETAIRGAGVWSGTITVGRPTAGSFSGSIPTSGGSDSYRFVPGLGGPAVIGSCAVDTGDTYALAVFGDDGRLLGRSTDGSYCQWVSIDVSAGRPYTVTTSAVSGSGAYRSSWSVNGAQVVWSAYSSIATAGGAASFSFPTLGTGPIALSTCGPRNAAFTLTLASANGAMLATTATPSSCQALSYTPSVRGLYRLQEVAVNGTGRWFGAITTQ